MKQLITSTTRINGSKASTIDLCFTDINHISQCGVINYNVSDHLPIYVINKKKKADKKLEKFMSRSYTNFSYEAFEAEINRVDWTSVKSELNPNKSWYLIFSEILRIADLLCPIKKFHITKLKPPYFTNEIIEYIKERETVFRLAYKKNDPV